MFRSFYLSNVSLYRHSYKWPRISSHTWVNLFIVAHFCFRLSAKKTGGNFCINGRHLKGHLLKQMANVIEWAISDRKGDSSQNHNHKIKKALRMMAWPLSHNYTRATFVLIKWAPNSRICRCWFIMIAGTKIDPVVEQIATHWTQPLITKALIGLCGWSAGTCVIICVSVSSGFGALLCFPLFSF